MKKTAPILTGLLALALAAAVSSGTLTPSASAGPAAKGRIAAAGAGAASTAEPLTVAVMELAVVDISFGGDSDRLRAWMEKEGIEPTGLLREAVGDPSTYAALEARPQFVSVGSPRIDRAREAKGFSASDCYAAACALAVGRALGADRVVTGEITKLSVLIWFVTGRVLDVQTGKVLRSDEFEVKGVITDLMPKVMVVLARRFASLPDATPPPVASAESPAR